MGLIHSPIICRIAFASLESEASGQQNIGSKLMSFIRKIQSRAKLAVQWIAATSILCLAVSAETHAQNINVTTPFVSSSDSFYEHFGVNFGFGFRGGRGNGSRIVGLGPQGQLLPNVMFSNGGFGPPPIFGGYNPNAAARFGVNRIGPNGGFSLGVVMGQGSTRTSVTNSPSLTVQNGFGGSFATGQLTPFVTGAIPVVGSGYPQVYEPDNGVTRAIQSGQLDLHHRSEPEPYRTSTPLNYSTPDSTATQADLSVSQIKAERKRRMQAQRNSIEKTLAEAAELERQENYADARTTYRKALAQTDDKELRQRINAIIKATRLK